MSRRVAVVTGSNKGIGLAIVKALCQKFDGDVILTARNAERGQAAVAELVKSSLQPKFHLLDIESAESVQTLRKYLEENYGGLDVLVNNAAIAFKNSAPDPFGVQAEESIRVNYTCQLQLCHVLFPILRPHARVVNMGSFVAKMTTTKWPSLKKIFGDPSLTLEQLSAKFQEFVSAAKEGKHEEKGWPNTAYGMSKVGICALTKVQARQMQADSRADIVVMAADPGWVKTDMSSGGGNKNTDQGAEVPTQLALLQPGDADKFCGKLVTDNMAFMAWDE